MARRTTKAAKEPAAGKGKSATGAAGAAGGALDAAARIVLLHGPDAMRMREFYQQLRDAVAADHGEVDPVTFDGETAELAAVLDELRTMSLLASFRVVVVDDAAEFVKRHRPALERYAQQPVDGAVLVLRSITWHKGNLDKLIAKVGAVRHCAPLTAPEATAWVVKRATEAHGRPITQDAAALLVRRLGVDLLRLDAELGKVAASTDAEQTIDAELVEAMTGRASDEKVYVVQRAVLDAIARDGEPAAMEALIARMREVVELAGESEVAMTYFVGDLMRKLYLGAHLRRQGASEGQMAKRLRLWGIDKAFFEAQRRLSGPAVGRLFDAVIDLDRRSKSGLGGSAANLERFCTMLADELHSGAAR